jgi:hypothetical protein
VEVKPFMDKMKKLDSTLVEIFNKVESTLIKHGFLNKYSRVESIKEQ